MNSIAAARIIISTLSSTDSAISGRELAGKLGANYETVRRTVSMVRTRLDAPIVSSLLGYAWRPAPHQYEHAKALVTVFGVKP